MITKWDNQIGNRARKPLAALVTEDGNVHRFTGASIEDVCESTEVGYKKAGSWSYSTFEVLHRDSTSFVSWMEDWNLGTPFPQPSWETGFLWLATQAPGVSVEGFQAFVREHFPKVAEKVGSQTSGGNCLCRPTTASTCRRDLQNRGGSQNKGELL